MKKKELTYEEAMQEVEKLIASLENNEIEIDTLAKKIKEASEYLRFCREKLFNVNKEIENVLKESEQ